ncbi:MAG TPA: outer membrane protein assembly factor BamD [Alphaproteobacteria bacterium]|nr:outer membrane protein assembly factor BamD [Alphaproteobacteria bacterium]
MPSRLRALALASSLLPLLAACGSNDEPQYVDRPVEQLYNIAADQMNEGRYEQAARSFDEVERQHPYSQWAAKAQLMAAFAHYEGQKYDDAIIALDRYIQLHPGSPDVPYAYYLKALSYYEQITDVRRDQRTTELAMQSLDEVVRRFPETTYGRDARLKIDLTRDHLAGKEMDIGRYYQRQGQHQAAIARFREVVDKFQTTTHAPEALHRLVESYMALGLVEEAKQNAAVLGHNYPGSPWYTDSYANLVDPSVRAPTEQKGFLSRAWDSIF